MKNKIKHPRSRQVFKGLNIYNQVLTKNIRSKKLSDSTCILKIHEIMERVRGECINDMLEITDKTKYYMRLTEPLYRYTRFLSRYGGMLYTTTLS